MVTNFGLINTFNNFPSSQEHVKDFPSRQEYMENKEQSDYLYNGLL